MFESYLKKIYLKNYFPFLLVSVGLLGVFILTLLTYKYETDIRLTNYYHQFDTIKNDTEITINKFIYPLQGTAGIYHILNFKNIFHEYKKYSHSRDQFKNVDGALGIGFIRYIKNEDINKYVSEFKKIKPDFKLNRIENHSNYNNDEPYYVIEAIEPLNENLAALGLVVSDEIHRKTAATQSLLTGQPTLTKKIQLVQAKNIEPGFLLFLPIYKNYPPKNQDERNQNIVGWAYVPILASHIFKKIQATQNSNLRLQIYEDINKNELIYENNQKTNNTFTVIYEKNIEIAGQTWIIKGAYNASHWSISDYYRTVITFIVSFTLTILSYLFFKNFSQKFKENVQNLRLAKKNLRIQNKFSKNESAFFKKMISQIPIMIAYWDKNLNNKIANHYYADFFKKSIDEFESSQMNQIFDKDMLNYLDPYLKSILNGEPTNFETEFFNEQNEKSYLYTQLIPDLFNNELKGFYSISFDITPMKKLSLEKDAISAELASKAKMSLLGEMAGGIAHEINNPLAIISGRMQILEMKLQKLDISEKNKEEFLKNFSTIINTVDRMSKIIKGLKSFARESDKDQLTLSTVDSVINDTLSLCREKLKNNLINIELQIDQNISLLCNPIQLSQVFMNLINNSYDAIKENSDDKWIKISTIKLNNKIKIQFQDSGPGIPKEIVEKIMNPFFTTKAVGHGTGLGLSISKGIIEKHGGEFKYDLSQTHTTFLITLPIDEATTVTSDKSQPEVNTLTKSA